VFYIENVQ